MLAPAFKATLSGLQYTKRINPQVFELEPLHCYDGVLKGPWQRGKGNSDMEAVEIVCC